MDELMQGVEAMQNHRMGKTITEHITPADGNVFADLGLKDAKKLKARAHLRLERERQTKKPGLD